MNMTTIMKFLTEAGSMLLQLYVAIQSLNAGSSVPISTYAFGKHLQITVQELPS